MSKTELVFDTKINDEEVKLKVVRPNYNQQQEGQKIYNRAFKDALDNGCMLREKLLSFMKEEGLWDDEKEALVNELKHKIRTNENSLIKGNISKQKARKIAIDLRRLRIKLANELSKQNSLDTHTAQAQADDARFNYWVSVCVVYNDTNKPVFKNLDDYQQKSSESYAAEAAAKFAALVYGYDDDFEMNLVENRFLKQFNFIDDQGRLINKAGQLVNVEGKLIDEDGYFIDEDGNRIDSEGNPLDKEGRPVFQGEFFDQDEEDEEDNED